MSVDVRGRRAGAALSESVAGLADPPGLPSAGRARLVLAAAVVLLVVAVAVVATRAGDEDAAPVATTARDAVPRLVPAELPDDLRPSSATHLPDDTTAGAGITTVVFAHAVAGSFEHGDLAVSWVATDGELGDEEASGEVRGRPAVVHGRDEGDAYVHWYEDGLAITVQSRSLGFDVVMEVVDTVTVADGQVRVAEGVLPEQMAEVGRVELSETWHPFVDVPVGAAGHLAVWDGESGRALVVVTVAADEPTVTAMAWLGGGFVERIVSSGSTWTVEGPGYLWHDSGHAVLVRGFGLSEDEVFEVARSLRAASEEDWAAFAQPDGHPDGADAFLPYTGIPFGSATVWVDGDEVCIEIEQHDSYSGACSVGTGESDLTVAVETIADGQLVWGRAPVSAVAVRVDTTDGTVAVTTDVVDGLFAIAVPDRGSLERLEAVDADGSVVGRVDLDGS